ncbi:hypothetical protein GCM10028814_32850 [Angustibacter aerolatus]
MQFVDADPDWAVWLPAPLPAELDDEPVDERTWAEQTAAVVLSDAGLPDAAPDDRERLTRLLALAGARGFPAQGWLQKWLHLPAWDDVPLPVMLTLLGPDDVGGDDERAVLELLVGAGHPAVVEAPVVEPVRGGLGDGVRAISYGESVGEDGAVLTAMLSYAWRVELDGEPVYVRLWTSFDPGRVIAAADDVEALATSLTVRSA